MLRTKKELMPPRSPRAGGAAAARVAAAQRNECIVYLYWIFSTAVLLWLVLKIQRVLFIAISVVGMIASFCAGLNVDAADDVATLKRGLCFVGMLFSCILPAVMPLDAHCGSCLGKNTPTRQTIDKFIVDCAMHKAANQQLLGKNNDLDNHKTTNGGIARKHPECFDDVYQKWDPCNFEDFTWISLSCMKN